jgi:hypothetical protein
MTENRPVAIEVDCETGVVTERPYTDEEMAQREIDMANIAAQEAERLAAEEALNTIKESAKAKLIAGEPLTEEEAATIVL